MALYHYIPLYIQDSTPFMVRPCWYHMQRGGIITRYIQPKSDKNEAQNHICNVSGANENGLRGRSGDLGLSAFANNSSPESVLAGPANEFIDANPLLLLLACCCAWIDSGGATAFTVGGLGLWILWNLNDETATSGD